MSTPRRAPWRLILASLYLTIVLALVVTTVRWGDEWWLATVMLFCPRWVYALPLVLLLPLSAFGRHRLLSLGALGASGWLLLWFNDVHLSRGALAEGTHRPGGAKRPPGVRVMTYNIGGGTFQPAALVELVAELDPDVVGLQECTGIDEGGFAAKGYKLRKDSGICLLTRLPIRVVDIRDPSEIAAKYGSGAIDRYELEQSGRPFSLELVHLETVRDGLEEAIEFRFWKSDWEGPRRLRENIAERTMESRVASEWARRAGDIPSLVMGDFNMPVDSAIYRTHWSPYRNALSERGHGHLVTKATRWHGIRIDHILFGEGFTCDRAWIGRHLGIDHRPVVADFSWSAPTRSP